MKLHHNEHLDNYHTLNTLKFLYLVTLKYKYLIID